RKARFWTCGLQQAAVRTRRCSIASMRPLERGETVMNGDGSRAQARRLRARIKRHWTEQFRVWRTALDWTVWVYFIVPGLWIGGGTYREMWLDPPAWLASLPEALVLIVPMIYLFVGRQRLFLEDADVLFLLQK